MECDGLGWDGLLWDGSGRTTEVDVPYGGGWRMSKFWGLLGF